MNTVGGKYLGVTGIFLAIIIGWLFFAESRKKSPSKGAPLPPGEVQKAGHSEGPNSNLMAVARDFGVRKAVLTAEEKADFNQKFSAHIRPAVERWCKAYENHLPLSLDQVTTETFKEKLGRNASFTIYTFVVDGITLCVQDRDGKYMVNYLNSPQQTKRLGTLPAGVAPNVQLPVDRPGIIRMVAQDSGTEFKPNEILLRPSGTGSSLNGGALVDIGPLGGDPNNGLCKLSLVFDSEGKLAYYCRDPFF